MAKTAKERALIKNWLNSASGPALLLLAVGAYALFHRGAPAPLPADAAPDLFSASRAAKHLQIIAKEPHPTGSRANKRVRDHLFATFQAMRLETEIQSAVVHQPGRRITRVGYVDNVIARIEGRDPRQAIVLSAHYDSAPNSPGANDDGVGVAALLETARALSAGPRPRNDIIIALVDGEESGLFGARVFAQSHPWAKKAALAMNFEGRGALGPMRMFETSSGNDWLIREYARAAPRPSATSLAYEVYRRLKFDTDLTEYRAAGLQGLNFSHIGRPNHYHTSIDNLDSVRLDVLQHHGATALSLARHFGDLAIPEPSAGNRVFFNAPPFGLFHYSERLAIPLFILLALGFLAAIWLGLRRGRLTAFGLTAGLAASLAGLILIPIVVNALWKLINVIHPHYASHASGHPYRSFYYFAGFVALSVALFTALQGFWAKRIKPENLGVAALAWLLLLAGWTAFALKGASGLFLWPALFPVAAVVWRFASPSDQWPPNRRAWLAASAGTPALLIVLPTATGFFWAVTVDFLFAEAMLVLLALGAWAAPLAGMGPKTRRSLAGLLALAALIAFVTAGVLNARFDADHPQLSGLFYLADRDSNQAWWLSGDAAPSDWNAQLLGPEPARAPAPEALAFQGSFLQNTAPMSRITAPKAEVLEDREEQGERRLRLRLYPNSGAVNLRVALTQRSDLIAAEVDGAPIDPDWRRLDCYGPPRSGVVLSLRAPAGAPIHLSLANVRFGLPPDLNIPPRPKDVIGPNRYKWFQNASIVRASYSF